MTVKPDLILFDCDGVLVDSEIIANTIDAEEISKLGWSLTPLECVERFLGMSTNGIYKLVEKEIGAPLPDGTLDRVRARVLEQLSIGLQPVEGVESVLSFLSQIGQRYCLSSSAELDRIHLSMKVSGLGEFMPHQHRFSADMVAHGKPAPDLFLYTAQQMGNVDPGRCLVIEDSPAGIQAAQAAGWQ